MKKKIINGFQMIQNLIKLRWVPEILKSIDQGNHRYSDILESIPNMSHTELNRKLAILTEKKVIKRKLENTTICYSLCKFGEDLIHLFRHLEDLEEKYFERPV